MTDPEEDICAAIAADLSDPDETSPAVPFAFAFTAEVPEDVQDVVQREHADLMVYLSPFGGDEERIDRGGSALVRPSATLIVIRRLDSQVKRRHLNDFVYSLRSYLRGRKQSGWTWTGSDTVTKFDPEQIAKKNQFLSVVRLNYYGTVSG